MKQLTMLVFATAQIKRRESMFLLETAPFPECVIAPDEMQLRSFLLLRNSHLAGDVCAKVIGASESSASSSWRWPVDWRSKPCLVPAHGGEQLNSFHLLFKSLLCAAHGILEVHMQTTMAHGGTTVSSHRCKAHCRSAGT